LDDKTNTFKKATSIKELDNL